MTSALSYVPTTAKLRSCVGLKDRLAMCADLLLLFACYPFYHVRSMRAVPPVVYRMMQDYRLKAGGMVFVMPGSCPPENTYMDKSYEPEVRRIVESFKEGVFVDAGAGLGLYTLIASRSPKVKVLALEPDPVMFAHLKASVEENGRRNVTLINAAAWSSQGLMKLHTNPLVRFGSSLLDESKPAEYSDSFTVVPTIPLDAVVPEGSPVLIKNDTEHSEPEVFEGAKATLQRNDVSMVFEALTPEDLERSKAVIEPLGYRVERLKEGRPEENNCSASRNYLGMKP